MDKRKIVWDIEANGLLHDSTKLWCLAYSYLDSNIEGVFVPPNLCRLDLIDLFENTIIIGHNIINYDIPMINKFYGLDLIELVGQENIIDTYIMSMTLYPDRQLPKGCPESVFNPVTSRSQKIGPHGLESWGYRVGHRKIEIHDWLTFSPDIIERCKIDVEINKKAYYELCKEAGIEP